MKASVEKIYQLPQKYVDLGFALCGVGENSYALRCHGDLVFFFVSGIDAKEDFVSQICESHVKVVVKEKSIISS